MRSLSFEPMIASTLWVSLAALAVVLLCWYGRRRPHELSRLRWCGILAMMGASTAALLLILLNPTWIEVTPPSGGKPLISVLLDASASMATRDTRHETRYAEASRIARELTEITDADVQVRTFAESTHVRDPGSLSTLVPDGEATDLGGGIESVSAETRSPGQAIVLLSDGIHNAGDVSRVLAASHVCRASNIPVYTMTIGSNVEIQDLRLDLRSSQELAFVGQQVPLVATLSQAGMPGVQTRVTLLQDGKELQSQEVTVASPTTVRFSVMQNRPGLFRYEVHVGVIPGEASDLNNRATFLLRTVQQPIRVMIIEGKPYWDTKFLKRTLAADPLVEVESVVRVAEKRLVRQVVSSTQPSSSAPAGVRQQQWAISAAPADILADPATLAKLGILILGRESDAFLSDTALTNLREWISREGGCLVCYRGSPVVQMNERLAKLLPVTWTPGPETRFPLSLTERGRELRWLADVASQASLLPTLVSGTVAQPKALTTVLANTASADRVAWAYANYGLGRVVMIEGAGMWRWAFLPSASADQDAVYGSLWRNLLRWLLSEDALLPGRRLTIRSEKVTFSSVEPVSVLLQTRDASLGSPPNVQLITEADGTIQEFVGVPVKDEPGAFRALFGHLKPGHYRARAGAPESVETLFDVVGGLQERLDLKSRPDLMARIAEESGGATLKDGSPAEVGTRLREHLVHSNPPRTRRMTAWDRWWVMLGVLGIWVSCWGVRRSGGLI